MTCVICGESAAVVETDGGYEERTCPSCGHCRITGAALVLMKTQGWYCVRADSEADHRAPRHRIYSNN